MGLLRQHVGKENSNFYQDNTTRPTSTSSIAVKILHELRYGLLSHALYLPDLIPESEETSCWEKTHFICRGHAEANGFALFDHSKTKYSWFKHYGTPSNEFNVLPIIGI